MKQQMTGNWPNEEADSVHRSRRHRAQSTESASQAFWSTAIGRRTLGGRRRQCEAKAQSLRRHGLASAQRRDGKAPAGTTESGFCLAAGDENPDASQIAFQLQSRWRYRALRSTVIFLPTDITVNHFGGRNKAADVGSGVPRPWRFRSLAVVLLQPPELRQSMAWREPDH